MVRLRSSALHTRVGRRFLGVFFISAFVPVCALAVLTWREVRSQLEAQAQEQMRDEAKRLALDVVGRLQLAAREARDIARRPTLAVSDAPDAMIHEVIVLTVDGLAVSGGDHAWDPLTPTQRRLLQSGMTILLSRHDHDRSLWMGVTVSDDAATLVGAEVGLTRLIDDAIDQALPATSTALVADHRDRPIYGDADARWPVVPTQTSGQLAWDGRDGYVGAFFKPPLEALFGVSHWTVAVAQHKNEIYAPIDGFLRQFGLVVAFTLGVVCLLSLTQMRRQLVPLSQLRDGARRLADNDFTTPILVTSGDEFQDLALSFDQMRGALRQTFDTLESRSAIDRAVLSSLDTDRIATTVVTSLARVVPSAAVACIVVGEDGTSSTTVWRDEGDGPPLTLATGLVDAAQFDVVREWSGARRREAPAAVQPVMRDAARLVAVPVHIDRRLAAVLALARTSEVPFGHDDLDLVAQIGGQVAIALTNAGLVQRLERLNLGTLNALARTIDAKSPWTAGHSERVTAYGVALARALGLDEATLVEMRRGGLLHDIGKIAIPSHILDKPGRLTSDEMDIVKRHPDIGARILEPIAEYASIIPIVREHHERWDGAGYPRGLRGEAISLGGRIFALADVFDALTSDRPYRREMSLDVVRAMFRTESGRHFDPALAPVFIDLMPTLIMHAPSRTQFLPAPTSLSA